MSACGVLKTKNPTGGARYHECRMLCSLIGWYHGYLPQELTHFFTIYFSIQNDIKFMFSKFMINVMIIKSNLILHIFIYMYGGSVELLLVTHHAHEEIQLT